jgi:hypothetical protein
MNIMGWALPQFQQELPAMQSKEKISAIILLILAASLVVAGIAFSIHQTVDHEDGDPNCILVLSVVILSIYALFRLSDFSYLKLSPVIQTGRFTTWRLDRPPRY